MRYSGCVGVVMCAVLVLLMVGANTWLCSVPAQSLVLSLAAALWLLAYGFSGTWEGIRAMGVLFRTKVRRQDVTAAGKVKGMLYHTYVAGAVCSLFGIAQWLHQACEPTQTEGLAVAAVPLVFASLFAEILMRPTIHRLQAQRSVSEEDRSDDPAGAGEDATG